MARRVHCGLPGGGPRRVHPWSSRRGRLVLLPRPRGHHLPAPFVGRDRVEPNRQLRARGLLTAALYHQRSRLCRKRRCIHGFRGPVTDEDNAAQYHVPRAFWKLDACRRKESFNGIQHRNVNPTFMMIPENGRSSRVVSRPRSYRACRHRLVRSRGVRKRLLERLSGCRTVV
jgi:hypothetical protein